MEQRSANSCRMTINEEIHEKALLSELRVDGCRPFDYRQLTIKFGSEEGSSEVQLGQTHVMAFVTSQLVHPYRYQPNEGTRSIFTEFSPIADPSFEPGHLGEYAVELGRTVERGLRESRAADTESLCVLAGRLVWAIRVDLHILDNGGNLVDAANIAALAALMTFRRPECTPEGDNGQEVTVHPPEVEAYNTERALKKVKRHSSSDAIEVDEPDIKLKEHRNPYVFKEIGESLKYHENRLKEELDRRCSENDGVEIRTFSSQQGASISGENVKSRISGPSNWDPYSKGIAPDFLRRLQASPATLET